MTCGGDLVGDGRGQREGSPGPGLAAADSRGSGRRAPGRGGCRGALARLPVSGSACAPSGAREEIAGAAGGGGGGGARATFILLERAVGGGRDAELTRRARARPRPPTGAGRSGCSRRRRRARPRTRPAACSPWRTSSPRRSETRPCTGSTRGAPSRRGGGNFLGARPRCAGVQGPWLCRPGSILVLDQSSYETKNY